MNYNRRVQSLNSVITTQISDFPVVVVGPIYSTAFLWRNKIISLRKYNAVTGVDGLWLTTTTPLWGFS